MTFPDGAFDVIVDHLLTRHFAGAYIIDGLWRQAGRRLKLLECLAGAFGVLQLQPFIESFLGQL